MHKILVLRPGALGDTILTLPALSALRQAFPRSKVIFAGHSGVGPLLVGHYADRFLSMDDAILTTLFQAEGALEEPLAGVDLAVLWLENHGTPAERLRRQGAKVVAAPSKPRSQQHAADYLLGTIGELVGHQCVPALPVLQVRPEDAIFASNFFDAHDLSKIAVIHPGSGGRWKCWPANRFAEVASSLRQRGCQMLLVEGPADEAVASEFLAACEGQPVIAKGLTTGQLAALLACSSVVVGNDSGVSHLAGAVGAPVVAIYGATNPAVWGVRGQRVQHVVGSSLEAITVAEVIGRL